MDQSFTCHFFEVIPANNAVPLFEDALHSAYGLGTEPGDRELPLSDDDTFVRLDELNTSGDWLEGEVVRVQRDNIPPEAERTGLVPSRAQSVAHSAVFRYNPNLNIAVVQVNRINMTPSRLLRYLKTVDETARYRFMPIPNEDLWGRYGRATPKKFNVTLSSVTEPQSVEGPVGAIIESSKRLSDMTSAPVIQIAVSSGGEIEGLDKGMVSRMIEGLLGSDDPGFEVTRLSVSADDIEDEGSEILNFLDDILKGKDKINLNNLNAAESRERRLVFLRDCFAQHMDYVIRHYDAG